MSRPPAKPVGLPVDPITRWHGATIEIAFLPFAAPTARTAFGRPICLAISPYERVSPNGMVSSARQTFYWNSVPAKSSRRSNALRPPEKYSASCRSAATRTGWSSSVPQCQPSPPRIVGLPQDRRQAVARADQRQTPDG